MLTLRPNMLKWILRSYPPFLFQRIWIQKILPDYSGADVKIFRSLFNINGNRTIFGGTIFAATDPLHPLLIDQIFKAKGYKKTVVWVKSARIEYKKPGDGNLYISIRISQEDISDALRSIQNEGKIVKIFTIEIYDKHRNLCAVSNNEIYIRNLLHESPQTSSPKEINTSEININSIN
ncbi:DUF4442 domain-containing protein [Sphingobacterium spiritivorum]|uniref:DUF4442 domain-containing protein n=1 Tax=Sphingobacterium spiritivorum TaxID=258 RepID=UPI00369835C8